MSCPERTKILALSATVSNGDQVKGWMRRIHGETQIVASDFRPVPLKYEFADGSLNELVPLFKADDVGPGSPRDGELRAGNGGARERARKGLRLNPRLAEVAKTGDDGRRRDRGRDRGRGKGRDRGRRGPDEKKPPGAMRMASVVRDLEKRDLLPAIVFVFSRRGCEEEAQRVRRAARRCVWVAVDVAIADRPRSFVGYGRGRATAPPRSRSCRRGAAAGADRPRSSGRRGDPKDGSPHRGSSAELRARRPQTGRGAAAIAELSFRRRRGRGSSAASPPRPRRRASARRSGASYDY